MKIPTVYVARRADGHLCLVNEGDFDPELPFRPRRAFERLQGPNKLADYIGREYADVYAACKLAELDSFESEISPAEYNWYLQAE